MFLRVIVAISALLRVRYGFASLKIGAKRRTKTRCSSSSFWVPLVFIVRRWLDEFLERLRSSSRNLNRSFNNPSEMGILRAAISSLGTTSLKRISLQEASTRNVQEGRCRNRLGQF